MAWAATDENWKGRLNEMAMSRRFRGTPEYKTWCEGADHNPNFYTKITIGEDEFTSDTPACQKKQSEQNAARIAVRYYSGPQPARRQQTQGKQYFTTLLRDR